MLFDSITYFFFFPIVWLIYQFVPDRLRWAVLLTASVVFYAALKAPILLIAWTGVVFASYYCGIAIGRERDGGKRKRLLWTGIAANIAVLCFTKSLRSLVGLWIPGLLAESLWGNLVLTIGVSYFTIQAISYLSDVYLEVTEPETHLGRFALYLGFFPKLLQGPIERANDLLPQLKEPYRANYDNLRSGLLLFVWGLFKKEAVANRLAIYVGTVYGDVHSHSGIALIAATYMYAIQILADFSGYTDMALGVARMFNIRLTQNFNSPYLASSIADFWRRWHISFSRWILDYLFKPLQIAFRSVGKLGTAAALLITFLLSGLWHEVSWNFLIWGGLHGAYLASSVLFKPSVNRVLERIGLGDGLIRRVSRVIITFNLVAFSWIFFRASSFADAGYIVTHLFTGIGPYIAHLRLLDMQYLLSPIELGKGSVSLALLMTTVAVMFAGNFAKARINLLRQPAIVRWAAYYSLILVLSYLAVFDGIGFVYLQF